MGKLKKEKHNHKLTDFLKVGIFSLVMLAPFISIGSKMAYVAFNKNAYESYSGNYTEARYIKIENLPLYDVYYTFQLNTDLPNSSGLLYIENTEIIYTNIQPSYQESLLNSSFINIWYNTTYQNTYITWDGLPTNLAIGTTEISIKFDLVACNANMVGLESVLYRVLDVNGLDKVFDYAVDQLGTSQIFAWTKNTAIYTPIETMTNGLGFDPDNNTLAILLTYWSLVTAVYVIMDIILFAFTKITHFTQD